MSEPENRDEDNIDLLAEADRIVAEAELILTERSSSEPERSSNETERSSNESPITSSNETTQDNNDPEISPKTAQEQKPEPNYEQTTSNKTDQSEDRSDDVDTAQKDEKDNDEAASQSAAATESADPLSIENENLKELELMNDINRLQNELKTAQTKVNTLQQQVQGISLLFCTFIYCILAMDKYKQTADSYLAVSEGAPDPVIWFENVLKVEREGLLKANVKNQELTKKIASLEKERNDSVVKNAKIEKSILDAKKQAESATKGEKYFISIHSHELSRNEKSSSF